MIKTIIKKPSIKTFKQNYSRKFKILWSKKYQKEIAEKILFYINLCLQNKVFPTISGFCYSEDIIKNHLLSQTIEGPRTSMEIVFSLDKLKNIQEELLINKALTNSYSSTFSIFTAKALLGWKDEQFIKSEHKDEKNVNIKLDGLTSDDLRAIIHASRTKALSNRAVGTGEVG